MACEPPGCFVGLQFPSVLLFWPMFKDDGSCSLAASSRPEVPHPCFKGRLCSILIMPPLSIREDMTDMLWQYRALCFSVKSDEAIRRLGTQYSWSHYLFSCICEVPLGTQKTGVIFFAAQTSVCMQKFMKDDFPAWLLSPWRCWELCKASFDSRDGQTSGLQDVLWILLVTWDPPPKARCKIAALLGGHKLRKRVSPCANSARNFGSVPEPSSQVISYKNSLLVCPPQHYQQRNGGDCVLVVAVLLPSHHKTPKDLSEDPDLSSAYPSNLEDRHSSFSSLNALALLFCLMCKLSLSLSSLTSFLITRPQKLQVWDQWNEKTLKRCKN